MMVEMEQRHHAEPLNQLIQEIENWNYSAYFLNRNTFTLEKLPENLTVYGEQVGSKEMYINNIIFLPQPLKNADI